MSKKNNDYQNSSKDRISNFNPSPTSKKKIKGSVEGGIFIYSQPLTPAELSNAINVSTKDLITFLFGLGQMVTINQKLDDEQIGEICLEFGLDFQKQEIEDESKFEQLEIKDDPKDLKPRPPVVTIMGHVDHGKTTLIDAIRNSHLTEAEVGGISQNIGAYQKTYQGKKITFIDTPGHKAFSEMRARGASVTDIVVLVVAADDGVMPQTIEAIDHAKASGVPIIIAINKMDMPGANPTRTLEQLMAHDVIAEEYGGDCLCARISAKNKQGIDELLELILLKAEMMELKANPDRYASGSVLEATLDKGEGPKATLLVQTGTLLSSDYVVVGEAYGKIRRMSDENRTVLKEALPSTPVSVIGLSAVPSAGDHFMAFPNEKQAREIAFKRASAKLEEARKGASSLSVGDLIQLGDLTDVNIIVRSDNDGTAQALKDNLEKLSTDSIKVHVISASTGAITDSDILLARASKAMILGFNVRPVARVREKAKEENVELILHSIIYELLEDMENILKGMVKKEQVEVILGQAEIRHIFKLTKVGTVGGSMVTSGAIKAKSKLRLLRNGIIIYKGTLGSLKRYQEDANEVKEGYECGLTIAGYNDIKEGDIVECYELVEK